MILKFENYMHMINERIKDNKWMHGNGQCTSKSI